MLAKGFFLDNWLGPEWASAGGYNIFLKNSDGEISLAAAKD